MSVLRRLQGRTDILVRHTLGPVDQRTKQIEKDGEYSNPSSREQNHLAGQSVRRTGMFVLQRLHCLVSVPVIMAA
ncbi:MAG: hypothetical protein JWM11_1971 [Planctomycetaceae bacterium]|nr:hypothetical protein [Planctomycetaceae bacterium]